MKINVSIKEKGAKKFVENTIASIIKKQNEDLRRIAEVTLSTLKGKIKSAMKHPESSTGKLENGFFAEETEDGWGIGKIAYLDANIKYWRHVDRGSEAIGANWQHWLPKGKWENGKWVEDPDGHWFKPSRPIPAMNFTEKTINEMNMIISSVLNEKKKG